MVKDPAAAIRTKNIIIQRVNSCFNFLEKGRWPKSGQPHQRPVYIDSDETGVCDMSWPRDTQCSVCGSGDHHCTRGRSPDSLYAALLVIRSSVKLSIAKTRDIGWWGRVMPEIINSRVFTFRRSVAQLSQTEFIHKSEKLCSLRENHSCSPRRLASSLNNSRFEERNNL